MTESTFAPPDAEAEMDDDDLPVLTQVLVTATGQVQPAAADFTEDEAEFADLRADSLFHRSLVIGSEPDAAPGAAAMLAPARTVDPVADPRRPELNDPFAVTAPDDTTFIEPIDESTVSDGSKAMASERAFADQDVHGADAFTTAPPGAAESFTGRPLLSPSQSDQMWSVALRDEVLSDLATRLDTELDARIARALRVEVETAIGHLQVRLRSELQDALRDVVGRAVDDALVRRRRSDAADH